MRKYYFKKLYHFPPQIIGCVCVCVCGGVRSWREIFLFRAGRPAGFTVDPVRPFQISIWIFSAMGQKALIMDGRNWSAQSPLFNVSEDASLSM